MERENILQIELYESSYANKFNSFLQQKNDSYIKDRKQMQSIISQMLK